LFDLGLNGSGGVEVAFKGHETRGLWSFMEQLKEGFLLSGSYDFKIYLWDLGAAEGGKGS
jgi:histone-binding protein RBBP4